MSGNYFLFTKQFISILDGEQHVTFYFKNDLKFDSFSLFLSFLYSWQFTGHIKVWRWLDSNRRPLLLEATALPTFPLGRTLAGITGRAYFGHSHFVLSCLRSWVVVVVAQLVKQSLQIPEVRGSNAVIGKKLFRTFTVNFIEKTKIKKKRLGKVRFLILRAVKKYCPRLFKLYLDRWKHLNTAS